VRRGWLARGWLEDFWYYACNNHPLLVTACTDPDDPFSLFERRVDAFATAAVTLLGAALLLAYGDAAKEAVAGSLGMLPDGGDDDGGDYGGGSRSSHLFARLGASVVGSLVQLLFVSLPLMASRALGFYLMGCEYIVL
jgi:hypothetical protein